MLADWKGGTCKSNWRERRRKLFEQMRERGRMTCGTVGQISHPSKYKKDKLKEKE